jgi:uncharacterized membrane-anchored protein YhcB (DUF1043 family)
MSKPAYVPPTEFMMDVMLNAMEWQNNLAKSLQDEVKQLKEERKLLKDTFAIQAELLKRSEYQITQLKREINISRQGIQNECPF